MEPMTLACRHCGAPLTAPAESGVITCGHCGMKFRMPAADEKRSSDEQVPEAIIVDATEEKADAKKTDEKGFGHQAAMFAPFIACGPFAVVIVLILAVFAFFAILVCALVCAGALSSQPHEIRPSQDTNVSRPAD